MNIFDRLRYTYISFQFDTQQAAAVTPRHKWKCDAAQFEARCSNQIRFITAEGPRCITNTATVSHGVETAKTVRTIIKWYHKQCSECA